MEIKIIRSDRRTLALEVRMGGEVLVRAPRHCSERKINAFVEAHQAWISHAVARQSERAPRYELTHEQIEELRQRAQQILPERVAYYSALTGLVPTSVKVTAAKTRFGSCSSQNRICFSLYLMQYSDNAVDYVVLHELAHIRYKNHSRAFYDYIARFMPEYKTYQKELKK